MPRKRREWWTGKSRAYIVRLLEQLAAYQDDKRRVDQQRRDARKERRAKAR